MRRIIATCLRALSETPIAPTFPIAGTATMLAELATRDAACERAV
ncbi:MAG TPA: hypothetical protein PKA13_17835 [Geminicoccaceae bacterium]|nr:hypothetical protein [Geminicoccus sp.]HMU51641.1 hypothetical protein [Geminicoccaceae bacterium]